jgi:hypothetical protein
VEEVLRRAEMQLVLDDGGLAFAVLHLAFSPVPDL